MNVGEPLPNSNMSENIGTEVKSEIDQDKSDSENDEDISRQFYCDMCQDVFTQMSVFESHIANVHLKKSPHMTTKASDDDTILVPKQTNVSKTSNDLKSELSTKVNTFKLTFLVKCYVSIYITLYPRMEIN